MSQAPEHFNIDVSAAAPPTWPSLSSPDPQVGSDASCSLEQSWQLIDAMADLDGTPPTTPKAPTDESIARWARIRNTPSYQNKRGPASLGHSAPVNSPGSSSSSDDTEPRQHCSAHTLELPRSDSNPRIASSSPALTSPTAQLANPVLRPPPQEWAQTLKHKEEEDFWDDLIWPGLGALVALGGMIYIGAKYHRRRASACA